MLGKENHERQIIKLLFKTVIEPYMWAVHIDSNPLVEYQNHQVAKNTKQKQNLQNKDSKNKYYCISAVPRKRHVVQHSSVISTCMTVLGLSFYTNSIENTKANMVNCTL